MGLTLAVPTSRDNAAVRLREMRAGVVRMLIGVDQARRAAARRAALLGALIGVAVGIPLWILGDPFGYLGAGVAGLAMGLAIKRKLDPAPPTQGQ